MGGSCFAGGLLAPFGVRGCCLSVFNLINKAEFGFIQKRVIINLPSLCTVLYSSMPEFICINYFACIN